MAKATRGKIMACENDKCEKYGMHHDYENGVKIRKCQFCKRDDQPERSKREDILETTDRVIAMASMYRGMPNFNILADSTKVMRCSEQ